MQGERFFCEPLGTGPPRRVGHCGLSDDSEVKVFREAVDHGLLAASCVALDQIGGGG